MNLDLLARVAQLEQRFDRLIKPEIARTLPFATYATDPYGISGPEYVFAVTLSRTVSLRSWYQAVYVATTNSAAHHWDVSLYKRDATLIVTIDTSAIAANTWAIISSTGRSDALSSADIGLYIYVAKSGSPGNINLMNPEVWVAG